MHVEVLHVHVKYLIMNDFLQTCFTRTCQKLFILQNINTCFPMIGELKYVQWSYGIHVIVFNLIKNHNQWRKIDH